MFKATLFVSFLFLSSAFAGQPIYKIDLNLNLNGKLLSSPSMHVVSGEKAQIETKSESGNGSFIEVTPEEIDGELKKVHLKFVVGVIAKGKRRVLSTPEMIVSEGKEGTITVGDDDGPEHLTLTVLANRQVSKK